MTDAPTTRIRETVRERYASAARLAAGGSFEQARRLEAETSGCGCGPAGCGPCEGGDTEVAVAVTIADSFGAGLYAIESSGGAPAAAVAASLGCGVPTEVAELREGETVLDLGSGAGADVLISARRVGPTGNAIGIDMTDEMLELARRNAAAAGVDNVVFRKGYIEDLPLADESVDVVISNCVVNLSADKARVLREAARVLRPGGRFAITDVIADEAMPDHVRADMEQWTGCVAGALTRERFERELADAGLVDVEVRETHRVHEYAGSAIVRARKPSL